jgi:DNA-binding Xre family transcriptional regulator
MKIYFCKYCNVDFNNRFDKLGHETMCNKDFDNRITSIISNICAIGKSNGMSMKDISAKADISNSFLSELSNGKKCNISLEKLLRVADAVGAKIHISLEDV